MQLTFLGAAGEVTGSCHFVETDHARFIVDCGMFQGGREADERNHARFAFEPDALDFVLLTHAHIDHSGLLPRLVARGYARPIYATAATCDLLKVMLLDSAHIQEKEALWRSESRWQSRRGSDIPLYTARDAERTLALLHPVAYNETVTPHPSVRCVFRDAGHILGSAIIEAWISERGRTLKGVFSGDLGQPDRPLMRDPARINEADFLLIESTYGNRLHRSMDDTLAELEHALHDTLKRKHGNVIVPAFAVGRAQEVLVILAELRRRQRVPKLDIYVDSPLATQATEITLRHLALLDPESAELLTWARGHPDGFNLRFVESAEESETLHQVKSGAVILSASGMCDAGRIKHHLRHNLARPECTLLITGFQAAGTLGRRIVDGAKEVRIFGIPIPVRADVYTIGGLSAHADQAALLEWADCMHRAPSQTFVVHGENETARDFAVKIEATLSWRNVTVPAANQCYTL
jgi:metallo-beta-lactamase family protein